MKYNKETVNKIITLVKADSYTNAEICKNVGISEDTFYEWQKNKPEFSDKIKKARQKFRDDLLVDCRKSLKRLINGYDYEETKTIVEPDKKGVAHIKEKHVTKKHVAPSVPATIFAIVNLDPENWKNRQTNEHTGKDGQDLFASLSDEELDKRISNLEKKLNK